MSEISEIYTFEFAAKVDCYLIVVLPLLPHTGKELLVPLTSSVSFISCGSNRIYVLLFGVMCFKISCVSLRNIPTCP